MGRSEKITFKGSQDVNLVGRLELPAGAPRACALFAHCFTCSKDVAAASRISRALAARGIAVLRFDFTGLGGSDGEFENTSFSSNVQDLAAAARYLRDEVGPPELLVGHSLGGAAVLVAAHEITGGSIGQELRYALRAGRIPSARRKAQTDDERQRCTSTHHSVSTNEDGSAFPHFRVV